MVEPMSTSAVDQVDGAWLSETGGAVPDRATPTPTVSAITSTSTTASRQNAPGRSAASAGSRDVRCHQPAPTSRPTRTTLTTTRSP